MSIGHLWIVASVVIGAMHSDYWIAFQFLALGAGIIILVIDSRR